MFKKLEGESCIINQGGTFKVLDLYEWADCLFAGNGSTFIRLYKDRTSKPKIQLEHITYEDAVADQFGRLYVRRSE